MTNIIESFWAGGYEAGIKVGKDIQPNSRSNSHSDTNVLNGLKPKNSKMLDLEPDETLRLLKPEEIQKSLTDSINKKKKRRRVMYFEEFIQDI